MSRLETLSPENQLLLCCARVSMDSATAQRIESLLRGKIQWDALLSAAARHGLKPLVYWHLHSLASGTIPKDVLSGIEQDFARNSARNLWCTQELVEILKLFESRGISAIPFKGPTLAASVYGNLALREFLDLDIVVPEETIAEAESLLRLSGYEAKSKAPWDRLRFRRAEYEVAYEHEAKEILVELHWSFAPPIFPFRLDTREVCGRAGWLSLSAGRVRHLSPEDLLLILCAHGGQHLWGKLEWMCAIAELLRTHTAMDWSRALQSAKRFKCERIVLLGLLLAKELLSATLPDEVLERISIDRRLSGLAAATEKRLFEPIPRPITAKEYCVNWAARADNSWKSMSVFLRMLFLPRFQDWAYLELPRPASFLYYPIRLFRLVSKYAQPASE